MKTDVYSWRVDADLKRALEDVARHRGESVAAVLDRAAREWLLSIAANDGEALTRRNARVMALAGTIRGGDPNRASRASELVREKLARKHGR